MKRHRTSFLHGAALMLALFAAAIPFSAFAQDAAAIGYSDLPGTITIEGDFRGRGYFVFETGKDTFTYQHEVQEEPVNITVNGRPITELSDESGEPPDITINGVKLAKPEEPDDRPLNVTVNGKPWTDLDKPFELGFATTNQPAMLETKAEGRTNPPVYMLGSAPLVQYKILVSEHNATRHYRIVLGSSAHRQQLQQLIRQANAKTRDITVTAEGTVDAKGSFVLEGNTVRYVHPEGRYPGRLSVNAMPWNVPDQPFELSFEADLGMEITVQSPGGTFTKKPADKDRFELTVGELTSSSGAVGALGFNLKVKVKRDGIPRSPNAVNPPAPVIPEGVRLQSDAAAAKEAAERAARANDVILTIAGTFDAEMTIHFEGNRIECRRDSPSVWGKPSGLTVNGKPWDDVSVPFQLDFTPDLTHARLVEKEGRGPVFVTKNYDAQFEVFVNDWEMGASDYMFKVAVGPTAPSVPKEVAVINESTKGMDHPDHAVTTTVASPQFKQAGKIVIRGTVDRNAGFQIRGNTLAYLNYTGVHNIVPYSTVIEGTKADLFGGEYASGVTVNGKAWSDLTRPFDLNISLKEPAPKNITLDAEYCTFKYRKYSDVVEIIVTNNAGKPVPFELTLRLADEASGK